jgi:hypothetical protein
MPNRFCDIFFSLPVATMGAHNYVYKQKRGGDRRENKKVRKLKRLHFLLGLEFFCDLSVLSFRVRIVSPAAFPNPTEPAIILS